MNFVQFNYYFYMETLFSELYWAILQTVRKVGNLPVVSLFHFFEHPSLTLEIKEKCMEKHRTDLASTGKERH